MSSVASPEHAAHEALRQTCELHAHHDHACHPEEQNIMSSLQQGAGVEFGHVWGVVGPPHSGERPNAAAEPCV